MAQILKIAICVSHGVTLSDFITPVEILLTLNHRDRPGSYGVMAGIPFHITIDYLAPTMEPVRTYQGRNAPMFNPTLTYADALAAGKQFDVLWIPAGPGPDFITGASSIPEDELTFIAQQAPNAQYIMSVCTGAFQLALAGVLAGKRATTNKMFFNKIVATTPKDIEWVARARWVVDGNVWTSSGVTAGADMALAFVEHLTNAKVAHFIRGEFEIVEVQEKDDQFAAFHGLV